jgi:hypothetical protein
MPPYSFGVVPPAGLEPAALCLASSIRLSLTARQSWGCWLDYILDLAVPTRIVSEDPFVNAACEEGFLRITQSSRIFTSIVTSEVPEALRASPHTGSSTQWVPRRFPHQGSNKADALSAELQGHQFNGVGMLTLTMDLVNRVPPLIEGTESSKSK